jgi:hypothetical protein
MDACALRSYSDHRGKLLRNYKTSKNANRKNFNRRAFYLVVRGLEPCRSNKEDFKAIEKMNPHHGRVDLAPHGYTFIS